jgi:hypothetical protein
MLCSQQPARGMYPEADESTVHPIFLRSILILSSWVKYYVQFEQQSTGASNVTFECPRSIPDKSTALRKENDSLLSLSLSLSLCDPHYVQPISTTSKYSGWNTGSSHDDSACLPSATAVISRLSDRADQGVYGSHPLKLCLQGFSFHSDTDVLVLVYVV